MSKITRKTHPEAEGWIHAKLTLHHSTALEPDELQDVATWGRRAEHDFALTEQVGKKCRVVFRRKGWQRAFAMVPKGKGAAA